MIEVAGYTCFTAAEMGESTFTLCVLIVMAFCFGIIAGYYGRGKQ